MNVEGTGEILYNLGYNALILKGYFLPWAVEQVIVEEDLKHHRHRGQPGPAAGARR